MARKRTAMYEAEDGLHIPLRGKPELVIEEPCAVGDIAQMMKIVREADAKVPPLPDPIPTDVREAPERETAAQRTARAAKLDQALADQKTATEARQTALVDEKPYVEAFVALLSIAAPEAGVTEADLYPWVLSGGWSTRFFNYMLVPFDGTDDETLSGVVADGPPNPT